MDYDIFLKALKEHGLRENVPNISENNAHFLLNLIRERNVKYLLEIWTANGYSSLQFAREIKKNGWNIDTIEFSQVAYEEAQKNIETLSMHHVIYQYYGDAREIIPLLEKKYDFIFIDGLKKASLDFFLLSWDKLKTGGIIVIDDVVKFRHKMEDLYSYLDEKTINYEVVMVDPDDGIMLIQK